MSKILLSGKAIKLYLLDMIDMKYIDLETSFISSTGIIFFRIDTEKLPQSPAETPNPKYVLENTIFDLSYNHRYILDKLRCTDQDEEEKCVRKNLPNDNDEYFIPFEVSPTTADGSITTFIVKHNGTANSPVDDFVTTTMQWLKDFKHPEYAYYKTLTEKFTEQANEWVRKQICTRLMSDGVKGNFRQDTIVADTYFHRRNESGNDIYYIVHEWWKRIKKGYVQWTDIDNGEGKIFVALNE